MSRTFEHILRTDCLKVAVSRGVNGFSTVDGDGARHGFDVDLATAVACALFGDGGQVDFVEIAPEDRLVIAATGTIDLGLFNLSSSVARLAGGRLMPMPPYLYDTEAALMRVDERASTLRDLSHPIIAVQAGTTTATNLVRYFHDDRYELIEFPSHAAAMEAYTDERVEAYVLDSCALHMSRERLQRPDRHRITDETISIESLVPAVPIALTELGLVVHAVQQALLVAEALAVLDSDMADDAHDLDQLEAQGLHLGTRTLLEPGFFGRAVRAVGHYGQVFNRNFRLRDGSVIPRRLNALVQNGGLHVATSLT